MPFIAGGYKVEYDTATIGQIEDGILIEYFANKRLITGDNYGLTPQDAIFQGWECFMQMTLMEYDNAKAQLAFWPFKLAGGFGQQARVGRLDSQYRKILKLTAVTGTPASASPATLTASRAVLAEGFPVNILFAPVELRDITLRFRLYLSNPSGDAPDGTEEFFALT